MKKAWICFLAAVMVISLTACGKSPQEKAADAINDLKDQVSAAVDDLRDNAGSGISSAAAEAEARMSSAVEDAKDRMSEALEGNAGKTDEPATEQTAATETAPQNDSGDIRPDVREAIDSYEAFVDEYCEFMKDYDVTDYSKLSDYMDLVQKQLEMNKQFEELSKKDLNQAEILYYSEVAARCSKKILDVTNKQN